jgi:tetratricopeptide (TPR) repeat protein
MKRRLNYRFLVVSVAVLVAFGVGTHLLHGYQVRRNASAFLREADRAEEAGDTDKAADYLARYLGLRFDDVDAHARYALLLEKTAKSYGAHAQALLTLDHVLRRDPSRADVRRRAAYVAMRLNRPTDARAHLDVLLKGAPDDPELIDWLGQCEEAAGRYAEAEKCYTRAVDKAPAQIDTAVRLTALLRDRLDAPDDADEVMEWVVEKNPGSSRARLARARYLRRLGGEKEMAEAAREVEVARDRLAADDADLLLTSADLAQASGKADRARSELERGARLYPADLRFPMGLASLELRAGPERRAEAVRRLRDALKKLPEQGGTAWALADLFLDAGERGDAEQLIKRMSARGTTAAVDYLLARCRFQEERYADAVALLERRRQELSAFADLSRQADFLAALCYERLGNPDRQLAALDRVVKADPKSLPAREGRASALLAVGRVDEALDQYRRLVPEAPGARLTVVRLLLARNLGLSADPRSWEEADALMKGAPEDVRKTVDFALLEADLLLARGKDDASKTVDFALLEEKAACKVLAANYAHPEDLRGWLALAFLAQRQLKDDPAAGRRAALRWLDLAAKEVADGAGLRLARAELLVRGATPEEAKRVLQEQEKGAEALPAAEWLPLTRGLAGLYKQAGAPADARRLWAAVAEKAPRDLGARLVLFDLALGADDLAEARRVVAELKDIEGENGAFWRYGEATRLVREARDGGGRQGLAEARRLLSEADKRRPGWPRVPVALGLLEEVEGDLDKAIDRYREAFTRGEREPGLVRRTVELLVARRRPGEAQEVLRAVEQQAPLSGDVARLAAQVSLLESDKGERALVLAARAVPKDSKDYRDHLWLGQVSWSAGKKPEAEAAFRRAVELAEKAPEARVALIVFLVATDRKKAAEDELELARKALPPEALPLVLAPCYEALGLRDKAEEQHLALLKARPDDPALLRGAANFYLRGGQTREAEAALRALTRSRQKGAEEAVAWSRRVLAVLLAVTGGYRRTGEALALLDETATPEDERARALVLAVRPGERRQSIKTLEKSFERLRPTAYEQFLLARLYEADRDDRKAGELLQALLSTRDGSNAFFISYYVLFLLRTDDVAGAATWLARLEAKEPKEARTLELQVRVLVKQQQAGKAAEKEVAKTVEEFKALVQEMAKRDGPRALRLAATALEQVGRSQEAGALYREYVVKAEDKEPDSALALVGFLARQGDAAEALKTLEKAAPRCTPERVAQTGVAVLRLGKPGPEHFRLVERLIEAGHRARPGSTDLLLSLADLRDAEGQHDRAIELYRQALEKEPDNALALNNLAWLLALHKGRGDEALGLVDRALAVAGRAGGLLDTRGVVLARLGRLPEAIRDLEEAVAETPSGARYFHLAQAYMAAKEPDEARKAWRRAQELGVKPDQVHALERADYRKLQDQLKGM